ncbi:MAG: hypothetical protein J2P31_14525 [Blastocatellia bacterium]|nr:hypothetical protein [Blastocatellia bacterium]
MARGRPFYFGGAIPYTGHCGPLGVGAALIAFSWPGYRSAKTPDDALQHARRAIP